VRALAARIAAGLDVRGVATSRATEALAHSLGIPLVPLDEVAAGRRGRRRRRRGGSRAPADQGITAARCCARMIVATGGPPAARVVNPGRTEKCVSRLGERGRLPIEVAPFAEAAVRGRLARLGIRAAPREHASDNGNLLIDCAVAPLADPRALERALRAIPGVIETGLFLDLDAVIAIDRPDGARSANEAVESAPSRASSGWRIDRMMTRREFLLTSAATAIAASAGANSGGAKRRTDAFARVRDGLAAQVDPAKLPGAVWLVAHGGDVVADAIGVTAIGGTTPMRRDTIFRLASMTKPITATAVLMLVEEGELALDAPGRALAARAREPPRAAPHRRSDRRHRARAPRDHGARPARRSRSDSASCSTTRCRSRARSTSSSS
jgi:ribose 5-phosphate isomerase A